jgi:hypothetical protein
MRVAMREVYKRAARDCFYRPATKRFRKEIGGQRDAPSLSSVSNWKGHAMRTMLDFIRRACLRFARGMHRSRERRIADYVEQRRRDLVRRTAARIGSY